MRYSAGPVEVAIPEGDGEIVIDTAATPHTYSMSGLTRGPEVRVAENCGNYAFSTRAGGSWAPALGHADGFTVSADGGTISGFDEQLHVDLGMDVPQAVSERGGDDESSSRAATAPVEQPHRPQTRRMKAPEKRRRKLRIA